jgi:hypothetical protein
MTVEEQLAAELQKQMGATEGSDDAAKLVAEEAAKQAQANIEAENKSKLDAEAQRLAEEAKASQSEQEKIRLEAEAKKAEEEKNKTVPEKSFEENLKEKSGGKYSKWEDVESLLNSKDPFANDNIKRLNELASKGIDVTSREFLELQSLDVDKIERSDDILFEKWKRSEDGEGLSEKTIRAEINKKYNVNEWIDKEDSELTEDDIANQEKMLRDAIKSKEWLKTYKEERVLEKQVDPKVQEAMAEEQRVNLANWEKYVESDLLNKVTKYTTPILKDGKPVGEFNFEIPDQDKAEVGAIVKGLPKDTNVFFNQFFKRGEDGKVTRDDVALIDMMLKAKNYDKAVALAYSDGAAKEALRIEKESKNTNFKAAEAGSSAKIHSNVNDALSEAVNKMKI